MLKQAVVDEIHKPARKNFLRRSVILKGIDDLWQADLIDFRKIKNYNKGFQYIMVIIDCFSKYVWALPIKMKTKSEVTQAFEKVMNNSCRYPNNLQTDMGTEFYNTSFKKLMRMHKINHYSTFSVKNASIVERVIRTLKTKLFKNFSYNGNYKWIGAPLDSVVNTYNNTKHRSTNFKPIDVNDDIADCVMKNINKANIMKFKKPKGNFSVGDFVRVSKHKSEFEKGYTPNWSSELFVINKLNDTSPVTYNLEDLRKQLILGCFYEQELQKTKYPNVYLIEKVIRRKGNKLFEKWLGLSESENSWIDKKAVL